MLARSLLARRAVGARFLSTRPQRVSSPLTWPVFFVFAGLGIGGVGYYIDQQEKATKRVVANNTRVVGKALLGGKWTLVDQNGVTQTETSALQGRFGLLYFGFTYCPDICPSEMVKMTKIVQDLDALPDFREKIVPMFITVDPVRDGVLQVGKYVEDFHPRTLGLTGTPKQIEEISKAFRVYNSLNTTLETVSEDDDYQVDHSIVMYLVAPDGAFLDFYTQMTGPEEAVERIQKQIQDYRPAA